MRATFGPTRTSLAELEGTATFADWIHKQIYEVPASSHREFYRSWVNSRLTGANGENIGNFTKPCGKGSRWVEFVVGMADIGKALTIQSGKISVDGEFRSNIDPGYAGNRLSAPATCTDERLQGWIDTGKTCAQAVNENNCQVGDSRWTDNKLCQQTCFDEGWGYIGDDCSPGWPSSTLEGYSGTICRLRNESVGSSVLLSVNGQSCSAATPFGMLNPAIWLSAPPSATTLEFAAVREGVKVLGRDASEGECGLQADAAMKLDGRFYRFDPRLELRPNTLESPKAMGGEDGGCNMVAPTPFNENSCWVASDCSPTISGIGEVKLSKENLKTFYTVGGKYVYVVTGLRTTTSPCGVPSRWKELDCDAADCTETSLGNSDAEAVRAALQTHSQGRRIADFTVACSSVPANAVVALPTGGAWQHVHLHEYGVYDFTEWVSQHSGGAAKITKWAEQDLFELEFPASHPMDRWEQGDAPTVVKKLGDVDEVISFASLPTSLKSSALETALGSGTLTMTHGHVCGSPGEVANDPTKGHSMSMVVERDSVTRDALWEYPWVAGWRDEWFADIAPSSFKHATWWSLALAGEDQLRQRMAWALNQIVVTSTAGVADIMFTEFWVTTYDIYVRNALGNYRDLLHEMTFSPTMGKYLSFYGSKSYDFSSSYPDENYAREIMQLFTIGLWELNPDGTRVTDASGNSVPTYSNDHVETFAKVFTGFDRQSPRPNIEGHQVANGRNVVDPFRMVASWHDTYPKIDLLGGYLGDGYPLCEELPANVAHLQGAKYIFLGDNYTGLDALVLNASSPLFAALCRNDNPSQCNFTYKLQLGSELACHGTECSELLRVVKVGVGYFEHIPLCVNYFFYNGRNTYKGNGHTTEGRMCGNPALPVAGTSCCRGCSDVPNNWLTTRNETCNYMFAGGPAWLVDQCLTDSWKNNKFCRYSCYQAGKGYEGDVCTAGVVYREQRICTYPEEYVEFYVAQRRCASVGLDVCHAETQEESKCNFNNKKQVWDISTCQLSIEVQSSGRVASHEDEKTKNNWIKVIWKNDAWPKIQIDGACPDACEANPSAGSCKCGVTVAVEPVFGRVPTKADLKSKLKVGAVRPSVACTQGCDGEVRVYLPSGSFDAGAIFESEGKFYKNSESVVHVGSYAFRNAPTFMVRERPTAAAAVAEVDALLDHLLFHPNTPIYISHRLIQRLTSSNPSPAYVRDVAQAFRIGAYNGTVYSGKWGDLAATAAAIQLHPEARESSSISSSTGATGGALREPVLKLAHLLRAMEYKDYYPQRPLMLLSAMRDIGQFPYQQDTVFNFYRFDYQPSWFDNGVYGPEFEIFTAPFTIGFFNGMHAAIDNGLDSKDEGFGPYSWQKGFNGGLNWTSPAEESVNTTLSELDLLLTGGRLAEETIEVVRDAYETAELGDKVKAAQRTIIMSPEFNTVGTPLTGGTNQPETSAEPHDPRSYKATVFLYMRGGADTFNLVVPYDENCQLYDEYHSVRREAGLLPGQLLEIGTPQQACGKFGVHYKLPILKELYDNGTAAFVANIGSLSQPLTKEEYFAAPRSAKCLGLFSHSDQVLAAQTLKCQERGTASKGAGGRIADALAAAGFSTESFSIDGMSTFLEAFNTDQEIVHGRKGVVTLRHREAMSGTITNLTRLKHANAFSQGFTTGLQKSLDSSVKLKEHLDASTVQTTFPDDSLAGQLLHVAKLMSVRARRKAERDLFYVQVGGFDTHTDLLETVNEIFEGINAALTSFVAEVKVQGLFESVTLVSSSDFGRTLTPNGAGTDHAWAGNHFVLGGAIQGGKMYGDFPSSLLEGNDQDLGRGRLIPKYPWESVLSPIAEWMGVPTAQRTEVFPNILNFNSSHLFSTSALYK